MDPVETVPEVVMGQPVADAQVAIDAEVIARDDQNAVLVPQTPGELGGVDAEAVADERNRRREKLGVSSSVSRSAPR